MERAFKHFDRPDKYEEKLAEKGNLRCLANVPAQIVHGPSYSQLNSSIVSRESSHGLPHSRIYNNVFCGPDYGPTYSSVGALPGIN
jgi:hypothetical protein